MNVLSIYLFFIIPNFKGIFNSSANFVHDIKLESGKQNSLGYTYKISKVAKVFLHYSDLESDKTSKNAEYFSVGFEYKF